MMVPVLSLALAAVALATPLPQETVLIPWKASQPGDDYLIPWKAPTGDGVGRPQDHLIPLVRACLLRSEHCKCENCVCIDCKCGIAELKKKAPYVFGYDDPIYGDVIHYDDLTFGYDDLINDGLNGPDAVPFYSANDFETG